MCAFLNLKKIKIKTTSMAISWSNSEAQMFLSRVAREDRATR